MNKRITLVRVPYLSHYNMLDVREEPIITSLCGYFQEIGVVYDVADFHLDRSLTVKDIIQNNSNIYISGSGHGTPLEIRQAYRW